MNSENHLMYVITWVKPFHYIVCIKKLFTKSTRSASEWFLSTIYLSLVGLFPTVGHTKKAVIPTPGLFIERKYAVSFNNLYGKYREPDLHCIDKNTGIPALFQKNNRRYCFTRPEILRTHMHKKKNNEKLVLICPPSLYPQPPGPKLWTFSAGCLGDGW